MELQPRQYYMGQGESYEVSPYESTNGDWCKSEDVAKLEAINAKLLHALKQIVSQTDPKHRLLDKDRAYAISRVIIAYGIARAAIAKAKGDGV